MQGNKTSLHLPTHCYWDTSRSLALHKIRVEEQTFKAEMCDGTRAFTQAFGKLGVRLSMLHNDELATP
ncbi:hypothetical protein N7465_008203 [Penicillium sp. CMV-2018d]|nr:hypothetical protein N7465_008203 [Penicillium sp. CMV-2018d]